jgi:hypothetical protein
VAQLSIVRVFDALFYPNIAYFIISSAMLGMGLSGIYAILRPIPQTRDVNAVLTKLTTLFAVSIVVFRPIVNYLPFDFNALFEVPLIQLVYFSIMFAALLLPFFLVGLTFAYTYTSYSKKIQTLYFWDLLGAAVGSVILIPFIPMIGPGGLLFCAAAFGLLSSALFSEKKVWTVAAIVIGVAFIMIPIIHLPQYYDFSEHQDKRAVKWARDNNKIETTVWDPISKIDVIDYGFAGPRARLEVMYDGGSQNSTFFPFDGNLVALRENLAEDLGRHFWNRGVLASHFILRDTDQSVLVIGSAGGQEIKAALMYGAGHVDGIELVGTVVELGRNQYSQYIGYLFQHPNVNIKVGEGRSFLRANPMKYDIIQIFSNHTSSSIAAGVGAVATVYLQTVEAYQEYFEHLSYNGILHINHHNYPRMITTAARAWHQMGRQDFQDHVVVFRRDIEEDTLPTLLIKNQPWTETELTELEAFFSQDFEGEDWSGEKWIYQLVEKPINSTESLLPPDYYRGELPPELVKNANQRIEAATDNRPYFNFGRKSFINTTVELLRFSSDPTKSFPQDVAPLYLTGLVSLLFAGVFTLTPLFFSDIGRSSWPHKGTTLAYFSCLGAGFIIIEIVFIQVFMRLIGSPLHTYTTVVASLLLSAGVGSILSRKLNIYSAKRWRLPFMGIVASTLILAILTPYLLQFFLAATSQVRILIAALMIFPMGVFLGMPFPIGILSLQQQPNGAIAWALGMNGLFTVIGGLVSIIISVNWGFNIALLFALSLYLVASLFYSKFGFAPLE